MRRRARKGSTQYGKGKKVVGASSKFYTGCSIIPAGKKRWVGREASSGFAVLACRYHGKGLGCPEAPCLSGLKPTQLQIGQRGGTSCHQHSLSIAC